MTLNEESARRSDLPGDLPSDLLGDLVGERSEVGKSPFWFFQELRNRSS